MHKKNSFDTSKKVIVALDLFCGAGGLTRGLLDAGIEVRLGVDFNEKFRNTYDNNNAPAKFSRADVKSLSGLDLARQLSIDENEQFLLAACAPCQPFSRHNKKHKYDRRKSLLLDVGRILNEFSRKPEYLFIENVPAIEKIDEGKVIKEFCRILESLNYSYKKNVVNAKDYGIPQSRKRFILTAVRNDISKEVVLFPDKTHGKQLQPYRTVRDAIFGLPHLHAGQKSETIINHQCAGLNETNLKRISLVPKNGGSRVSWPEDLILECHKSHTGHKDVYGRMKWDAPSPTLTCRCTSISNGRYGHPAQDRAISLREAACLQTFPMEYEFYGNFQAKAMQIGNAVPPLLAEVFGRHLIGLARKSESND